MMNKQTLGLQLRSTPVAKILGQELLSRRSTLTRSRALTLVSVRYCLQDPLLKVELKCLKNCLHFFSKISVTLTVAATVYPSTLTCLIDQQCLLDSLRISPSLVVFKAKASKTPISLSLLS